MTGSRAQWYNGMLLLSVFFSCRLIWGVWQSAVVYGDMWSALQQTWSASAGHALEGPVDITAKVFTTQSGGLCFDENCARANAEISKFKQFTAAGVPTWLVVTYVTANLILNFLNYVWFHKMVQTVLKRFRDPSETSDSKAGEPNATEKSTNLEDLAQEIIIEAAAALEQEEGAPLPRDLPLTREQISSATESVREKIRRRNA